MQKLMPVYRVVSYILLAIAGFLCLIDVIALLVSLASTAGLLGVFILTGVIIYTFTSFYFYREGLQKGRQLKKSTRDWVRVNGFVAIAFCVLSIPQFLSFLFSPKLMADYYQEVLKKQPAYASSGFTQQSFVNMFSGIMIFFVVYCVLLLAHVVVTLALLKKHASVFGNVAAPSKDDFDELR